MKLYNKVWSNTGAQPRSTGGRRQQPEQNNASSRYPRPNVLANGCQKATAAWLSALTLALLVSSAHAQKRPAGFLPDDFAGMSETNHPAYGTSGTVRYASPNGSGTACTTSNRCSLATALSQATSGTVVVGAGDYRVTSALGVKAGVTLQAEGTSKPRIKGSTVVAANKWTKVAGVNRWYTDSTPPGDNYEFLPTDNDPKPEEANNPLAYNREAIFSTASGGSSQPLVQVVAQASRWFKWPLRERWERASLPLITPTTSSTSVTIPRRTRSKSPQRTKVLA